MEPISHKMLCQVILSRSCSSGTKLKIFLMSPQREQWKFKINYVLSNQMAAKIMEWQPMLSATYLQPVENYFLKTL